MEPDDVWCFAALAVQMEAEDRLAAISNLGIAWPGKGDEAAARAEAALVGLAQTAAFDDRQRLARMIVDITADDNG